MTATVSPIFLVDSEGAPVPAELWDGITEQQINDWQDRWKPEFEAGVQRLKESGLDRTHWPQSVHWDWRKKAAIQKQVLAWQGFSVMCDNVTQGLMITDTVSSRSRIPGQAGQHLVYVQFLETAPWNQKPLVLRPRYKGVGSILLAAAIELSAAEQFAGRIGLHSLPQSDRWYSNKCGMTDLGPDAAKQDLRYFEMTAAQANGFMQKGGVR